MLKEEISSQRGLVLVVLLLLAIPVVNGNQKVKPSKKKSDEAPPPTVQKFSVQVPSLAALEESPQSQTKGGLRITLSPETYQTEEIWKTRTEPANPPRHWGITILTGARGADEAYVRTIREPDLKVKPDRLVLHVHLSNQMPRVFRGSGIAVQFNIAGKVAPIDPSSYGDLTNIILPPRSEQDVTVIGPKVTEIPAPSTVGIFFYDVVTNLDQAGNVTEKQNFEWYFSYQTQLVEKEIAIPPPTEGWIVITKK